MDKNTLIKAGIALYGERWQTSIARDLGFSDGRRIRQWLSGDRPIPDGVRDDLIKLMEQRKTLTDEALSELKLTSTSNKP